MNQIRLLILHTDTEYASALARAVLKDVICAITLAPEEERCYTGVMEEAAITLIKVRSNLIDEEWKKRAI